MTIRGLVKLYCPISFPLLVVDSLDTRYQDKDVNKYAKKETIHYCSCDLFRCDHLSLRWKGQSMMIDQTQLISSVFPLVGGGAIGFGVGYVIKKLMKLAFIGLGLVMLVLGFLEY